MMLRKMLSRHFTKTDHHTPTDPPPLPSPDRQAFGSSPDYPHACTSTPNPPRTTSRHIHRRSRSFSDLNLGVPPWIMTPMQERNLGYSPGSSCSQRSVDQPWRSQDTWRALHTPPRSVSSPTIQPIRFDVTGGWRDRAGEGFFSARHTPRQRRRVLADDWAKEEREQSGKNGESSRLRDPGFVAAASCPRETSEPNAKHELQGDSAGKSSVESPSESDTDDTRPHAGVDTSGNEPPRDLVEGTSLGKDIACCHARANKQFIDQEEELGEEISDGGGRAAVEATAAAVLPGEPVTPDTQENLILKHQRNESLLPPLLPANVDRLALRSSSFASPRPTFSSSLTNTSWTPTQHSPDLRPIPWGGRSSVEKCSASPNLHSPAVPPRPPRSLRRVQNKPLPSPPTNETVSSTLSSPLKPPSMLDTLTTDEEDGGSANSNLERVVTPVTPPRPLFRPSKDSLKATDAAVRSYMSMIRKVSSETINSSGSRVSRGGWI